MSIQFMNLVRGRRGTDEEEVLGILIRREIRSCQGLQMLVFVCRTEKVAYSKVTDGAQAGLSRAPT